MLIGKRTTMSAENLGPMKTLLKAASEEVEFLNSTSKHWVCKGRRSVAVAVSLLQKGEVIAIPTDTVYGFAGIVTENSSIKRLYEIKQRDEKKPLCISVSNVNDIFQWGVIDHLPPDLLPSLLPGPYTVVLKRTSALNPALNPGVDTVGIRVPDYKFINCVAKVIGPLALTSANRSNQPSCIDPTEFEKLWPELGGIFHEPANATKVRKSWRKGSTIVDLSCPGYYKIIRYGVGVNGLIRRLKYFNIKPHDIVTNLRLESISNSN